MERSRSWSYRRKVPPFRSGSDNQRTLAVLLGPAVGTPFSIGDGIARVQSIALGEQIEVKCPLRNPLLSHNIRLIIHWGRRSFESLEDLPIHRSDQFKIGIS